MDMILGAICDGKYIYKHILSIFLAK